LCRVDVALGNRPLSVSRPHLDVSDTDAQVDTPFSVELPAPVPVGAALTATATDAQGDTSEFSVCGTPEAKGTIVVRKQTLPAASSQSFAFTTSYGPGFSLSDGQSNSSAPLAAGSYSVSEAAVSGWDTTASCDDGSSATNISLSAGETVTCTFTNYKRGTIVVKKQTQPAGAAGTFAFTGDVSGSIGGGGTITVSNLSTVGSPTYRSTESDPTPSFDLASISCDDATSAHSSGGDLAARTASFRLDPGETVTCTFTNAQRGTVSVRKTVSGSPLSSLLPASQQSFTFQLRQGASTISAGTLLEQADANVANGGVVSFTSKLLANSPYQLCEFVMPGWRTNLTTPFVLYNTSGDNSTLCMNFSVDPGQLKSVAVDNRPPPGGLARTIGFWKNWASCANSSGKQGPVLDQTLVAAEPGGITIGTLTLHGSSSSLNRAPDCLKAVRLLDKSTIDTGKKMSSDPAFNVAAQLLAADLNVKAGALSCPSAISAINDAQTLLAAVHFNGITHDKLSSVQTAQANALATTLDRYNNNRLC
jgi:Prealbumin-like fold domain